MTKQKIKIAIPIVFVGLILSHGWFIILSTNTVATWRQYLGLILFLAICGLFVASPSKASLGTGIFILLGTFNLLAITADINTSWLRIGPITTPEVQLLFVALFVLYIFLNVDVLIDLYLDYKETKKTT